MGIRIGVIRESGSGEKRVALTPEVAKKLQQKGATIVLQSGAGLLAGFADSAYPDAEVLDSAEAVAGACQVLLHVLPPTVAQIDALAEGAVTLGYLQPHRDPERIERLRDHKITAFGLEVLPRTTRAQAMDVLSSQASVAGYKAVLIAAELCAKFFPMLTTAAGTIRPAKVLIIGAGVAGLLLPPLEHPVSRATAAMLSRLCFMGVGPSAQRAQLLGGSGCGGRAGLVLTGGPPDGSPDGHGPLRAVELVAEQRPGGADDDDDRQHQAGVEERGDELDEGFHVRLPA